MGDEVVVDESDDSDSDSSSSSGSSSESSTSSSTKRKRAARKLKKKLKKEKKKAKKKKKKEKKERKKEKKRLKKELKKAKKEKKDSKHEGKNDSRHDGKQDSRQDAADWLRQTLDRARVPEKTRASDRPRSPDRCSASELQGHLKHTPWKGSLLDVCEAAARGMSSKGSSTIKDTEISVYDPDGELVEEPRMFKTFEEVREFPPEVQSAFRSAGFPGPSQIQSYCWPLGFRGKDIIGIAATGSGKTLAFLLPAFIQMRETRHDARRDGPGLLVMSPTRELAQQTEAEGTKFGACLRMNCVAMYGGAPKGNQMSRYRQGCACVVACPGRLNDFLEGRQVQLRNTTRLVLDEADRMLDMGFEPQIRKILEHMPTKRHTLFFTATWPREIQSLAREILHKPYKVMIGNRDELKANADVTQLVRISPASGKLTVLSEILMEAGLNSRGGHGKCLIFCSSKRMCEQLTGNLLRADVPCAAIHGDKDQQQRDQALNDLKVGRIKVLCGTDVAARGLDIKGVGLVVNFDPANNAEDYVHRIGRTGRAGAKGVAITLLTPDDGNKARNIVDVMARTGQGAPPELLQLAATARAKGGGKGDRHVPSRTFGRSRSRSRSR